MSVRQGPEPSDHYATISKDFLRDSRLSFKARGIGLYIIASDAGELGMAEIARANNCGVTQVRAGIAELERYGYLTRQPYRDADGRHAGTRYDMEAARA